MLHFLPEDVSGVDPALTDRVECPLSVSFRLSLPASGGEYMISPDFFSCSWYLCGDVDAELVGAATRR